MGLFDVSLLAVGGCEFWAALKEGRGCGRRWLMRLNRERRLTWSSSLRWLAGILQPDWRSDPKRLPNFVYRLFSGKIPRCQCEV